MAVERAPAQAHGVAAHARYPGAYSLIVLTVLALGLAVLFWPTWRSLREEWIDTEGLTYTHGYLVLAVCAWLTARAARSFQRAVPDLRLVLPTVLLSAAWLLFLRAGIEILHQMMLPVLALLAACVAVGTANGRKLAFAFGYLYFAIPVWSMGNAILQSITVVAVSAMLKVTAVPAYVAGNFVQIPSGAFEIAGGCSGLHFFIVALAVAALFGEVHRDRLRVRVLLLLLAAILAVVSNWVRVYTIILAGHLTDMQHYLITEDHYYFGWGLFVVTMVLFFWLAGRIPATSSGDQSTAVPSSSSPAWLGGVLIALVAASIGPAIHWIAPVRAAIASEVPMPTLHGVWTGPVMGSVDWRPIYPGADRTRVGGYRRGERTGMVFLAQYLQQQQGKELIGFDNNLAGEHAVAGATTTVETRHGPAIAMQVDDRSGRSVVAYYYRVGDMRTVRGLAAQFTYAVKSLSGPVVSSVVAARTACVTQCDSALADAIALLDAFDAAMTDFDQAGAGT